MALNPYLEKVLGDASMPKIQFVDINESLEYIGTATVQTGSQSNTDVNKEVPGASMPSFPVLECPSNSEYIVVPEESDPSTSEVPNNESAGSGDTDKTASGLKTVPTAPKTIYINKPPVTTTTASSSLDATAGSEKSATPKRQLQLILENGRMIAAPQPVGRPNVDSTKTAAAGHDASSPAVSKQRPKVTVIGPSGSRLDLSNTADEIAKQTESVLNVDVIAESDGNAVAGGTRGNDADSVASVEAVGSTCTCTPDYPCEVIDVLPPVGTKRKSRVVYSKVRPLVEAPTASAVLDAVQSAAGLSHLVFESKGRQVGTMISTKDGRKDKENAELVREDDQQRLLAAQSQQQVVITSQQGDQQVLVTLDGDLLRTAGASDASNLLLQVDEASDSVTLLVNRPGKEGMYEIAGEEGELLELWERDSKGNDRLLGTVSEVSLVDIRAVCEQCNCVISHHMVGMLVREDGSEYGYRCRLCQCVQTDVDVMARHMESHRSLADTQCRFCSRGLRTFQPQHPRSFPCHACDKVFSTRSEMLKHREVHPPKRRFPCEMCDKTFQVKVQLEVHVRTHLGHKPYTCDMCTAAFTQPSHLINHRRTHTGERPYVCRQCGRAFVQQGHLRSHERTHTGERPYKCDLCGRGFRQSGQLTAHKKLHEGDAPCKLRRRFDDPITPEELTCQECNKTFKLPKDLKRHMLVHSEGQYKCEICERAFKRPDHLLRHKRQHDATRRKMKRRLRREVKLQDESLTRLDRVIDDVLDEPYRLQLNNVMEKLQNDQGDFMVEDNDEDSGDDCDDSNVGVEDGEDSDDPDNEEDDRDERHTRVSSAPKDALWSQTDHNYDPRRQQADLQDEQKLGRSPPYGTRSRLLRESFTDHGVDEEMAILEAAFNEQRVRTGGKGKKSWDVPKDRLNSEEQTVKLEPIDWVECDIGGGGDGSRRDVDRNTGGKRKRLRGATDAEDLVLSVWDDGDTVEVRSAARVKLEDHPTRTTARSTAGNRAASVGVSLTRSSHHGGRR